jgi:hypothetical protein
MNKTLKDFLSLSSIGLAFGLFLMYTLTGTLSLYIAVKMATIAIFSVSVAKIVIFLDDFYLYHYEPRKYFNN